MPDSSETMPDVVYHYTSMDTLLKIAATNVIRATSIRYLNDVTERLLLFEELRARLALTLERPLPKSELFAAALESGMTQQSESFSLLPFVASFSASADSLPQWRAYCPHGNGVAIGIRTESLHRAKPRLRDTSAPNRWRKPTIDFDSVLYHLPGSIDSLDRILEAVSEKADNYLLNQDGDDIDPSWLEFLNMLGPSLESQASLVKHSSFASEEEFRLVVNNITVNGVVDYRASGSTLVPFTEVDLPNPTGFLDRPSYAFGGMKRLEGAKPYFIESITVGPTPHDELSCDALRYRFRSSQYDVDVSPSRVPFREMR